MLSPVRGAAAGGEGPEAGDGNGLVARKRLADDGDHDGHDAAGGLAGHGRALGDPGAELGLVHVAVPPLRSDGAAAPTRGAAVVP